MSSCVFLNELLTSSRDGSSFYSLLWIQLLVYIILQINVLHKTFTLLFYTFSILFLQIFSWIWSLLLKCSVLFHKLSLFSKSSQPPLLHTSYKFLQNVNLFFSGVNTFLVPTILESLPHLEVFSTWSFFWVSGLTVPRTEAPNVSHTFDWTFLLIKNRSGVG